MKARIAEFKDEEWTIMDDDDVGGGENQRTQLEVAKAAREVSKDGHLAGEASSEHLGGGPGKVSRIKKAEVRIQTLFTRESQSIRRRLV